ncbi:MAG: shikimate dehydrogenase [Armatimonadetes bacterium]|nr:shikimate dehydrogenase [Armatimonadota bacterium]
MEISGSAKVLGLFAHPVGHSMSPAMHNAAIRVLGLDYVYVPFDVAPEGLEQAVSGIRGLGIAGVNVTMPHKEAIIAYLDEVDPDARDFGSVNTVTNAGGRLIGASTDGPGFMRSLTEAGFSAGGKKAVVLGAGGAGRAVTFALTRAGARAVVLDEVPEKADRLAHDAGKIAGASVTSVEPSFLAEEMKDADLLVNCTPVGMHPREDAMPVSPDLLRADMLVYDLVYNPVETRLISAAKAAGAHTLSGVRMLVYQGAISFKKWTGVDPPTDVMEAAILARLDSDK